MLTKQMLFNASISDIEEVNPLFSKCKILVMHHGENRNNTYISKESVEEAAKTIFNIPIVGEFLEEAENFGGHGGKIVVTDDGEFKYVQTTKPIGVVAMDANPRWEFIKDKDDIKREYLVVDGYLWNKYQSEVDTLKLQDFGQSMEIEVVNGGSKTVNDHKYYDIQKFLFSALCILGVDKDGSGYVEPCFADAKISVYGLNKDKFKADFSLMIKELKETVDFTMSKEEVGEDMKVTELEGHEEEFASKKKTDKSKDEEKDKKEFKPKEEDESKKTETTKKEEDPEKSEKDKEKSDTKKTDKEDPKEKKEESKSKKSEEDPEEDTKEDPEETDEEDKEKKKKKSKASNSKGKFEVSFELSHDDVRKKIYEALSTSRLDYWISQVFDTYFIAQDGWYDKYYKVSYTKENDEIQIGEQTEVFVSYLTQEEKSELEGLRSKNKQLEEFKLQVEKDKHEASVSELLGKEEFSALEEEDIKDIKEHVHKFSLKEIESTLYERLGKKLSSFSFKAKESKEKKMVSVTFSQEEDNEKDPYNGYFDKY